jgi:hypothetical protein
MDYFITDWQEIASIVIVALTVFLLVRNELRNRKHKKDCGNCALIEIRERQRYRLRN